MSVDRLPNESVNGSPTFAVAPTSGAMVGTAMGLTASGRKGLTLLVWKPLWRVGLGSVVSHEIPTSKGTWIGAPFQPAGLADASTSLMGTDRRVELWWKIGSGVPPTPVFVPRSIASAGNVRA